MNQQILIEIIVPTLLFYYFETIILHEDNPNYFHIPIISDILIFIYNKMSNLIYDKFHSKKLIHSIIYMFILISINAVIKNIYIKKKNKYNKN